MKKIILSFLGLFLLILNGLYATDHTNDTRATIKKTGNYTVTIYARPQTSFTSPDVNLNFSVSLDGTSGPGPTSASSLINGLLLPAPVEIFGNRRCYPYVLSVLQNVSMTAGIDNPIATVTFPATIGNLVVVQLNDYTGSGANQAYWYISHSGGDQTNQDSMFYGTNPVNILFGDSKVDVDAPLPVKLLAFSAEKSGEKSAMLNWSTASESNSSYFSIERSLDKVNWKGIGQVKAAGNSQIVLNYQYLDNNVYNGVASSLTVYYRLKMVDFDGTYDYSPIESVNFGKPRDVTDNSSDFLVYPNPASEGIHVEWDADQVKQPTAFEFYDLAGKLVYTEKVEEQTDQQYVDFTKTNIQTGLVMMRVLSGDETINYKQIVVGQNH